MNTALPPNHLRPRPPVEAGAAAFPGLSTPIIVATIARPSGPTGVQTHFSALLAFLRQEGQAAVLVTPYSYRANLAKLVFSLRHVFGTVSPSFNVWWYEKWHYVFLRRALKRQLAGAGQAVVYAQCPLSAQAALEVRNPSQRVVMAVHFNESPAEEWAEQTSLRRGGAVYQAIHHRAQRVLPALDGIVYVSTYSRERVEASIPGASNVRAAVLPNFVAAPAVGAAGAITNDLISIGTLEPRKNQAYLLHVLSAARAMGKVYSLTLVGDGPDRRHLEALARSLDIGDQVKFEGFQPQARRSLARHRVYVHSARIENLPVAVIEALAHARPVIAPRVGGIPDIFSDGVEGFFWDLTDAEAGARKLVALLEDPDLYGRMSAAAASRFAEHFETRQVAGRLREFILATDGEED